MSIVFGRGVGVLAILLLGLVIPMKYIIDLTYGIGYWQAHKWPASISLTIVGIIIISVGLSLNGKALANARNDRPILSYIFKAPHHFCFLSLEFWGVIYIIFAATRLL